MTRGRLVAVALAVIAGLAIIGVLREMGGTARQRRHVEQLRDELRAARAGADSCALALRREEAEFQAFAQEIDSLRQVVRDFEAMHEDGVPAARYDQYIAAFDRYNAGVPAWEARADTLRAHWDACRAITERHNLLVDSLRAPGQTSDDTG